MVTSDETSQCNFVMEVEEVVTDAQKHPRLIGRIITGAYKRQALDLVEIRGEKMGWLLTKLKQVDLVNETGESIEKNVSEARFGTRISLLLTGDPITALSPQEKLLVGSSLPDPLVGKTVENRLPVGIQTSAVVFSGCLVGAALFLFPVLFLFGRPAIGLLGVFIFSLFMLGTLVYGLIVLLRPVVNWLKLKLKHSMTTAQVLDKRLAIMDNDYGGFTEQYAIIIEFTAQDKDSLTMKNVLLIESKKFYTRYAVGSNVDIRYAVSNPRIMEIKDE